MIRSKNALRDGNCFAQQRLGFFEAIYPHKGVRVVVGCNESSFMFFAVELQTSGIYVSQHAVGFFKPFKRMVRARKIALRDENVFFWCANAPHRSQVREGGYHREPGYERVDKLLADVEAAGSWAGYAREPRKKMLVLAKLCEKGRATPPRRDRVFGALFAGTGGGSRRKGAAVVIPREVFWKVFEFWPCSH